MSEEGAKDQHHVPFDPNIKYKVRDQFWIYLFILYVCGMIFISYCTVSLGNINRLRFGTDSDGNICGTINIKSDGSVLDLTNYPFIFFMDKKDPRTSKTICVSHCPSSASESNLCSYLSNHNILEYSHCVRPYPSKPSTTNCY